MASTPLPPVPLRTDAPDLFVTKGDAFIGALPQFQTDLNAQQLDVATNAAAVTAAMPTLNSGVAAANAAQATANATAWVSGKSYAQNNGAISQVNFQTYRKISPTTQSTTTDPANDPTNWVLLFGNDANGAFLPIAMAASTIDLSKGNYFTNTVASSFTLAISNTPSQGYSFTWEVTLTSGSIAFPSSVKFPGDGLPSMATGKTHLLMFVTSNGGARWRVTFAPNFTT